MKTSVFYLILWVLVISCDMPKYDNTNETYEISVDSLCQRCAELKGLGPFIIGETTKSEVQKSRVFQDVGLHRNDFHGSFKWSVSNEETRQRLVRNTELYSFDYFFSFQLGDIPFWHISMAFYKNRLVAIQFDPKDDKAMLEHYINKFGNGIGYNNSTFARYKDNTKDRYNVDEQREWYNSRVRLSYRKKWLYNNGKTEYISSEFLITDNSGAYEAFLAEIDSVKNKALEDKNASLKASYDAL